MKKKGLQFFLNKINAFLSDICHSNCICWLKKCLSEIGNYPIKEQENFAGLKSNSTADFLMGGREMHIFPTMLSVVATFLSGILLMGVPADIYQRGNRFIYLVKKIFFQVGGLIFPFFQVPTFSCISWEEPCHFWSPILSLYRFSIA